MNSLHNYQWAHCSDSDIYSTVLSCVCVVARAWYNIWDSYMVRYWKYTPIVVKQHHAVSFVWYQPVLGVRAVLLPHLQLRQEVVVCKRRSCWKQGGFMEVITHTPFVKCEVELWTYQHVKKIPDTICKNLLLLWPEQSSPTVHWVAHLPRTCMCAATWYHHGPQATQHSRSL